MSGASYRVIGADEARLQSLRQAGVAVPSDVGCGRNPTPRDLLAAIAAWQAEVAKRGSQTRLDYTTGWSHFTAWEVTVLDEGRPEDPYEDRGFYATFGFPAPGEDNAHALVCQARTDSPALAILWQLSRIVGPLILEETELPQSYRSRALLKAIFGPSNQEKEWKATKPSFVLHSQTNPEEVSGAFE